MYQFFSPDLKELNSIIDKSLAQRQEKAVASEVLQTGWTNITMNVKGEKEDYIFRFPRNLFFAQAMIKDCMACQFLKDKISVPVPKMALMMDKNRPYSMHPKIKGEPLDKIMSNLSSKEKVTIVQELAQFLVELQRIPLQKTPQIMQKRLNDFLKELADVHQGNYDFNRHSLWEKTECEANPLCLAHGDFHPGNILIGGDKKVSGVIDFAFITVSDRHADLGRFFSRSEPQICQALFQAYQDYSQKNCQPEKIQQMADLFHYVDCKYVQYMQRAHPEIIIPKMLLSPTR